MSRKTLAAVHRTPASLSLSKFARSGTTALAAGAIFPRVTAAVRRTPASLSLSNPVTAGTAAGALEAISPKVLTASRRTFSSLSVNNCKRAGIAVLEPGASRRRASAAAFSNTFSLIFESFREGAYDEVGLGVDLSQRFGRAPSNPEILVLEGHKQIGGGRLSRRTNLGQETLRR